MILNKKRIALLGANGQLGLSFQKTNPGHEIIAIHSNELDLTSTSAIVPYFNSIDFDILVNCAAYTAVDQAESEPDLNDAINHLAVVELSKVAQEKNIPFYHFSTDFVFDGNQGTLYTEEDETNPIQAYGQAKRLGEKAIDNACVIRTSWLYSEFGHNFVKTIRRLAKEREQLTIVADQIGTPTYAPDLALAVWQIIDSDIKFEEIKGIYHYSNEGVASWYDFAQAIVEYDKIDCNILPIPAIQYPTPAKRPSFSVMDKSKIKNQFNLQIPYWRLSLLTCLKHLSNEN